MKFLIVVYILMSFSVFARENIDCKEYISNRNLVLADSIDAIRPYGPSATLVGSAGVALGSSGLAIVAALPSAFLAGKQLTTLSELRKNALYLKLINYYELQNEEGILAQEDLDFQSLRFFKKVIKKVKGEVEVSQFLNEFGLLVDSGDLCNGSLTKRKQFKENDKLKGNIARKRRLIRYLRGVL